MDSSFISFSSYIVEYTRVVFVMVESFLGKEGIGYLLYGTEAYLNILYHIHIFPY